MGTWKLVDKPKDAVPIANKWMFIKKRNKAGEISVAVALAGVFAILINKIRKIMAIFE